MLPAPSRPTGSAGSVDRSTSTRPRATRGPGSSVGSDGVDAGETSPGSVGELAGSGLFEALRAWRLERARADAVPPYVIFHDSTLGAIADRRPRTLADLAAISGIGPTKLDRYGEELVSIVVRFG